MSSDRKPAPANKPDPAISSQDTVQFRVDAGPAPKTMEIQVPVQGRRQPRAPPADAPATQLEMPALKVPHRPRPPASFWGRASLVTKAVIVALGLAAIGGASLWLTRPGAPERADLAKLSKPERITKLMGEGQKSFAEGKFDAAAESYRAVLQLDSSNTAAAERLAQCKPAEGSQDNITKALAALESHDFGAARAALRQIPSTSPGAPQARALWTRTDQEEGKALFAQGETQVKSAKLDLARATMAQLKPLDDTLYAQLANEVDQAQEATGKSPGATSKKPAH